MMDRLAGFGRWARMKHWYKCIHETRGTSGDKKSGWSGTIGEGYHHIVCTHSVFTHCCDPPDSWNAIALPSSPQICGLHWPVWFWPDQDIVCNQPTHNSGRKQKYNASQVGDIYIMIDETMLKPWQMTIDYSFVY